MTRRRWIADEVSGTRAAIVGEHARHLGHVLRAQVGQEFEISVDGDVRLGRVAAVSPDRVEFDLGDVVAQASQSPIVVAMSIFKFDRMEWAIEKCTELGVTQIIPVIAARTESHLASAAPKRVERWRRIAQQASEQARRVSPPHVADPTKLHELLATQNGHRIVLSEVEQGTMLKDLLLPEMNVLTLAFGPEGGWKESEVAGFAKSGWKSASLGPTILRAETAVISAVAVSLAILAQA
jgi:16S rRNA (uracil1498-N3)-methyltransferase